MLYTLELITVLETLGLGPSPKAVIRNPLGLESNICNARATVMSAIETGTCILGLRTNDKANEKAKSTRKANTDT